MSPSRAAVIGHQLTAALSGMTRDAAIMVVAEMAARVAHGADKPADVLDMVRSVAEIRVGMLDDPR